MGGAKGGGPADGRTDGPWSHRASEPTDRLTAGPPDRPLVPVIIGPTGVGKTAVAAAWAEREPITVISADARQVYRRLDVGTAKPDRGLLARVPHLGIDLVEPGERYSAGGLFREPPLDPVRREQLGAWTTRMPVAQLAHWAARLDRRFGGGGRQRAARVLEVALLTGRSLSWWQREARETGVMRPWYIHLTLPRDALQRRIADRVDRMLAAGLVDEVRHVLAQGVPPRAPGLDGVGYREVVALIEGRLPASSLRDAILVATRRYAKRQETWFRNQLRGGMGGGTGEGSVWTVDATEQPEVLAARIRERWHAATRPPSPVSSPVRK